jgi:hypothetical protein
MKNQSWMVVTTPRVWACGLLAMLVCATTLRCGGDSETPGAGSGGSSAGTGGMAGAGGSAAGRAGSGGGKADSGTDSAAGTDGGARDGGPIGAQPKPGFDLVAGGTVMHAPLFTLIATLGESPGGNSFLGDDHKTMHSPLYTLQTGLIPTTERK